VTAVAGEPQHHIGVAHASWSIAGRAHLACVLEATAPKPGNVSPGRPFADMRYEDFLLSAQAIAQPLEGAGRWPLGETILRAVEATASRTRANTNLGIVLLLAPLARAAILLLDSPPHPERGHRLRTLRAAVAGVLADTTVEDASKTFRAIRLANPGGLGTAEEQDVAAEPTVTLLDAMRLAADRDGIAREYASSYETTFDRGVPALLKAREDGLAMSEAIVEAYLTLLADKPDTHIARRGGDTLARRVSELAAEALSAGGVRSDAGRLRIAAMDASLRDPRNLANPGTAADLTAAAIFAALIVGGWAIGPIDGAAAAAQYQEGSEAP
jgi:triphosphoribosyl-dephospho-CoA synthase